MEWALVGAGAVLSASLQVLFDRVASRQFLDLFQKDERLDELLKKLMAKLVTVNAVLDDAEEKQITNPAVKEWLDELKDAVYGADDLLDDIVTQCQMEKKLQPSAKRIKEAEEIIQKLEYVAQRKDLLGLKEGIGQKRRQRLPTTSLVDEFDVYGRAEDEKKIINLLKSDEKKICMITLVGMAGIGKTTLAQLVYNHVNDTYLKAWVWISEEFDMLRVTKTILEALTSKACDIMDLNVLQVRLKARLKNKKFFLVLDDVWEENYIDWDVLRRPFITAAKGSKIIITTRNESVRSIIRTGHTHYVKELPDEDCWTLFAKRAFEEHENPGAYPKLEEIGKNIVKKCKGLPLAIKTLGGLLYSKVEEREWVCILNSEIWDLPNSKNNILPALRLSYYHLPSHLKRCFAYCSIFPKGNEFEKEQLVLLWLAEGFVESTKSNKSSEEIGDEYFQELVSRSFFQRSSCKKSLFVMHDLINDLAQSVSREFCVKLDDGKSVVVSGKTRHLGYNRVNRDNYEVFFKISGDIQEAKYLRTFLPSSSPSSSASSLHSLNDIISKTLLKEMRCLRVLSLPYFDIKELPDEIRYLKHLRYLDLSGTMIKHLPDSTSSLYNLQTLMLSCCKNLKELPPEMWKLINLRHLKIATGLEKMPIQFRRLKSLQTLNIFVVSRDKCRSNICELGELSHLHGSLTISKLQEVIPSRDALEAKLNEKEYLEELVFKWDEVISPSDGSQNVEDVLDNLRPDGSQNADVRPDGSQNVDVLDNLRPDGSQNVDVRPDDSQIEDVLDNLKPHKNLKRLTINHYRGISFPAWLGDASFSNIVSLRLQHCASCSSLPPVWRLACLTELLLEGMKGIHWVLPEFYDRGSSSIKPFESLEILKLQDMSNLVLFSFGSHEGVEFPSLRELYIKECSKLTGNLPGEHLTSLKKLELNRCDALQSLQLPTTLSSLSIFNSSLLKERYQCKEVRSKIRHICKINIDGEMI